MLNVDVFIQCQFVTITSRPWSIKMNAGKRLITKAVLTAVFTCVVAQSSFMGVGLIVVKSG